MIYKKGQEGLSAIPIALVVSAVLIIIGLYTFAQIYSAINTTGLPAATVTAIQNVNTTAMNAFTLITVGLIVLAAAAIVAILFRLRG